MKPLRILHWHVHGSWSTAFVQGRHTYLLPVRTEYDHDGVPSRHGGRPQAWQWPDSAIEVEQERLAEHEIDVVVLQRPEEIELVHRCTGRRPGPELPALYLEHNTPRGDVPLTRHPVADRDDLPLVHVSDFNELMWDSGRAPTAVVRHGVPDPGYRYSGELGRAGVVVNEPVRRGRITGTDLLPRFAAAAGLDVFGMGLDGMAARLGLAPDSLTEIGDLPQPAMHTELARRRVYLHTTRWTSLGLSLIEAMALGMPVVALATTEAVAAVPPSAGVVATRVQTLVEAVRELVSAPRLAREMGRCARQVALRDFGLAEFLQHWDELLKEVSG
ncbi:MAG TPA: glycosyltransferase [Pseudonocardiaceae bacterium]|nr:glycosyltransferase [Pseudonocardiaceae bacterium]